jgi:hypothetical protein
VASPSVTYTFANSTTADATQVNQNFTDIINGISDGTKDLSISALTCAGTATFNGNVAVGNSSADTLTITAVLSSSIGIGTTYLYDIGSATVGLRSVYLGSADSAARSTRVIGATVASSWTLTLPTTTGTADQILSTNGSGVTTWVDKGPRSQIVFRVPAYGATNTSAVTFEASPALSTGTALTRTRDTSNGDTFTINESGIYTISFGIRMASSGSYIGIGRNLSGTQITTAPSNFGTTTTGDAGFLIFGSTIASSPVVVSWTGFLAATDVIRIQIDSGNSGFASSALTITKVSN